MSRLLVALVLAGCATPRPAKMSFEEAAGGGGAVAPAPTTLDAALGRFIDAVRTPRLETAMGAAMPARHVQAWTDLLDEADRFLGQRGSLAWTAEALRARLQLEGELQTDARLFGDIPPTVSDRVPRTLATLSRRIAARSGQAFTARADPRRFSWPVAPLVVSSAYGSRVHPIAGELRFHAGIDLEAPRTHPVTAAEDGKVTFSGWSSGYGNQVELQHDAHWATRYAHLEELLVEPGARVKKGQLIGRAGATGVATGPHLHFELRRDGDALDPEAFIPLPAPAAPSLLSSLP